MTINATECYPIEEFSAENVRAELAEAQKIASGSGSEADIAEAKIEIEVWGNSVRGDNVANSFISGPRGYPGFPQGLNCFTALICKRF